ncbi:MAG: hypothetical protein K0R53_638 [Burkholderiales bacterium]|nr:hypothetical protein [Burkholderiales bacterium]HJQ64390.1 hypothetical protein [Burkholderiales bacterium]
MDKQKLRSLRMNVTKVQALIKAVELSQRGLDTEESKDVALCMRAAYHLLESVHGELALAEKTVIQSVGQKCE